MRTIVVILCVIALTACASPNSGASDDAADSTTHVVRCEQGWNQCYIVAAKVCGSGSFTEVDRLVDGSVSPAGHLESRHTGDSGLDSQVYSENPRADVFNRVLTFRCD